MFQHPERLDWRIIRHRFKEGMLICCILLAVGCHAVKAQMFDTTSVRAGLEITPLIREYLSTLDSADTKIRRLVDQARQDQGSGRPVMALQKLQIALALEEQPDVQVSSRFDLYHTLGDQTYRFHPTYADVFYKRAALMTLGGEIDPDRTFVLMTNRAGLLAHLGQTDSAAWYYRVAIQVAPKVSRVAHASAQNNLGYFYESIGAIDSASVRYHKALDVLGDPVQEMILYCSIRDNLASIACRQQQFAFADSVYRFNDSVYHSLHLYNRYLINGVRWLKLRIQQGDAGVEHTLQQLDDFSAACADEILPGERLKFYETAADYYVQQNKPATHLTFNRKYRQLRDQIERTALSQTFVLTSGLMDVQEIQFQRELDYQRELNHQKQSRLRMALILMISLALAAGAVIFFLGLLIRNRRQKLDALKKANEAAMRAHEMEARLIEQELRHKEQDLTRVALHNTHVHEAKSQWIARLQGLQQEKPETIYTAIRSLLHDLEAQNRLGTDLLLIQSKLGEVNDAFYSRLQQRFPGLTKSEQELCGYVRIQLSTKDIALLRNVESASVKMAKNRLRKKLGIDPEADLYAFIQAV